MRRSDPEGAKGALREGRLRRTKAAQTADVIKQRIKRGIYAPGEQLPSIRALGADLSLTLPVVQRAIKQLEIEGLLESRHGVGVRVLESANCRETPLLFGFVQPYFSRFSVGIHRFLEDALDSRSNLCVIKSTRNDPVRERDQIERLVGSGVNGLLIWPVDNDPNGAFLNDIARRLPVVFVDRTIEGVRAASVVLAYRDVGRKIVRRMASTGRGRILVACDPVRISTFDELREGMRQEAERVGSAAEITFLDLPLLAMIEATYHSDFGIADRCRAEVEATLSSGRYDAIFSPLGEFYEFLFDQCGRADILDSVVRIRLSDRETLAQDRVVDRNAEIWVNDTPRMMVLALDLLQDMTLRGAARARGIRVPFTRVR